MTLIQLGTIPTGWDLQTLADLAECLRGVSYDPDTDLSSGDSARSARLLRSNNVQGGLMTYLDLQFVNINRVSGAQLLQDGDIVICTANGSRTLVGKSAIFRAPSGHPYTFGAFMGCVRSRDKKDSRFLGYVLHSSAFRRHLDVLLSGSAINNLKPSAITSFSFATPPPKERWAIADALGTIDELLASLNALITKKQNIKAAIIQDLLNGNRRLPGFTAKWNMQIFADLAKCLRGVSYDPDTDLSSGDSARSARLLRSNNVQGGLMTYLDLQFVNINRVSGAQLLQDGDIVICTANGSRTLVGKSAIFRAPSGHPYTFGAFMGCVRSRDKKDSRFLGYVLHSSAFRRHLDVLLSGSAINNLKPSAITSFSFATPPPKERWAIADVLGALDEELSALSTRRRKTDMVKQAMMTDLLTGKRRLA